MAHRRSRLTALVLGALGLLAGLLIMAGLGAPRIAGFTPDADAGPAPASARIALTFSRSMNPESVQERLHIEPVVAGTFAWEDRTLVFRPAANWPQGTQVSVHLASGALSVQGLPLLGDRAWAFEVGAPRVVYLWPAHEPADIYVRSVDGRTTERLTETPLGVYDYGLSGDGSTLVYLAERADGGTDLRILDLSSRDDRLAYASPAGARCRAPALSQHGLQVAFELIEVELAAGGTWVPGPSRVWALDLTETGPAFPVGLAGDVTSSPAWSPAGWLAYYDNTRRAIAVVDPAAGPEPRPAGFVPSELGDMGDWSVDGQTLVFPEIVFPPDEGGTEGEAGFYIHLFRTDVATGETTDLSATRASRVEDASPAHSPDGRWIAFARKYLEADRWTLGRQLWVMRSDGSGARSMTEEAAFNHSSISFSPDSTSLVYMRFNLSDLTQSAEIWMIEADGDSPRRLAQGGYLPRWIP
jgi:Tol biopolymer transport system component